MEWLTVIIYVLLLVGMGIAGGRLSAMLTVTHERLQMVISFVAGLMLGIGLLRMMPHSAVLLPTFDDVAIWITIGLVLMFICLRMFHFHQHAIAEVPPSEAALPFNAPKDQHTKLNPSPLVLVNLTQPQHEVHEHDHGDGQHSVHEAKDLIHHEISRLHHPHHHHQGCAHDPKASHESWSAIFLGLTLHTTLDGFALGASIQAAMVSNLGGIAGLGTFLAVLLHKPLDTMTLVALMSNDGIEPGLRRTVVVCFSLVCPLAMILALAGLNQFGSVETYVRGAALACSAGMFLCISLSDLLPEIEFHSHDRVKLTSLMLAGVLVAYLIGWLEPQHRHQKPNTKNIPYKISQVSSLNDHAE